MRPMRDLLATLLRGPQQCAVCGAANTRGTTCCHACGERLRNRNPLVRFVVTGAALAVVASVIWFKLRR